MLPVHESGSYRAPQRAKHVGVFEKVTLATRDNRRDLNARLLDTCRAGPAYRLHR